MNEQQIRALVQQEIAKNNQMNRFNLTTTPNHAHTGQGQDGPRINQSDVVPGLRCEGSIVMAHQTVYKIGITFNPSAIWVHGNVTGPSGARFMVVGNAQLGPSYYLQPNNATSVITGGPQQKVIQSTTYFGLDSGGAAHTLVDETHIVDVFFSATIFARATVTSYDNRSVTITVDNLVAGWQMNLSWTVT